MTKGKFELKPCPFCGSKNIIVEFEVVRGSNGTLKRYWCECGECNASYRQNPRYREEDAVKVWNDARTTAEDNGKKTIKVFTVVFDCSDPYDVPTEDDIMDALTFHDARIQNLCTFTCTEVYIPKTEGVIEVETREMKQ